MADLAVTSATQLRHRPTLRTREALSLTVYPDDGRLPETFRIPIAELRRFAWAILAETDPIEATVAANEDGAKLADLIGNNRVRAFPSTRAVLRPPQNAIVPGDERHRVLVDFGRRGELKILQVQAVLDDRSEMRAVIEKLRNAGFVERTTESTRRERARFKITQAGREELVRLAERRAA